MKGDRYFAVLQKDGNLAVLLFHIFNNKLKSYDTTELHHQ